MSTNTITDRVNTAATTFWNTDTSGKGHLSRGKAFYTAQDALIEEGNNKTQARKIIAERVAEVAPAHSKKFGPATVNHYVASYSLMAEHSPHPLTALNGDLYAVVHKAYAASMGVEAITKALKDSQTAEDAALAVASLKRESASDGEGDDEKKSSRAYGVATALRALVKIAEHEWTEDEKAQLFEASLAVSVHVQPAPKGAEDTE